MVGANDAKIQNNKIKIKTFELRKRRRKLMNLANIIKSIFNIYFFFLILLHSLINSFNNAFISFRFYSSFLSYYFYKYNLIEIDLVC